MSSLNKIILVGELRSEPDIKATNSGDSVCNFVLTVQRPVRVENANPGSDDIKVVAWREKAELMKTISEGQMILVEGRINTRSYDNNEGQRVYVTEVEARDIRALGSQQSRVETFQMPKASHDDSLRKPRKKPALEEMNTPSQSGPSFDFSEDEKVLVNQTNGNEFESDDIPF